MVILGFTFIIDTIVVINAWETSYCKHSKIRDNPLPVGYYSVLAIQLNVAIQGFKLKLFTEETYFY